MSPVVARCGDGKLSGDGGAEYPCVSRFRYRRLIAFLWLYGFEATAESMLDESDAICSPLRLQQLVQRQQWRDAQTYLCRFLPRPLSVEAHVLHRFLGVHTVLASIIAGVNETPPGYNQYLSHDRTVSHGAVRIRSIILSILYARHQVRTSIDWECVRYKAAEIIVDLVYRTPELKDLIFMPAGRIKPYTVLPIGFRPRRHPNKPTRRPRPSALAKVYTGRQRRLPAISDPSQEYSCEMTVSKALDWVADIVDECLKAGRRPESHPLQTSRIEGVTVAPVLQTTLSSLTSPAINPGPSMAATQVQNAGSSLTSHVPTSSAPFLGTVCTPVPQTAFGSLTSCSSKSGMGSMANAGAIAAPISGNMFGSLARPAINPGMPSVANAGNLGSHVPTAGAPFLGNTCPPMLQTVFGKLAIARYYGNSGAGLIANSGPLAPVSQTMNLTNHAESSGAITAPVLQTMSCSLTRPINPGMSLMADADKLASHMPTPGAPFLGNMGASLSQNGFGSLTSHCESSGMAQIANTGATVCPVSQTTNLTSHCGETGAPVALAVQKNLASHAESSGSHVAPAVQTMNFASHAESSEINNSDQVGCNGTDQGFSLKGEFKGGYHHDSGLRRSKSDASHSDLS